MSSSIDSIPNHAFVKNEKVWVIILSMFDIIELNNMNYISKNIYYYSLKRLSTLPLRIGDCGESSRTQLTPKLIRLVRKLTHFTTTNSNRFNALFHSIIYNNDNNNNNNDDDGKCDDNVIDNKSEVGNINGDKEVK
jgi:hypothetical protein